MIGFLEWLKWFFWDCRRCEHVSNDGTLVDMGRKKVWHCVKCGKCLWVQ